MNEDYKLQLSTTVNGNLLNVRAQSGSELKETLEGLEENIDEIIGSLGNVKTAIVGKDIFTGNAGGSYGGSSTNSSGGSTSSGPPKCKHGDMKDLKEKNYKHRYYCPERDRDAQCKPED